MTLKLLNKELFSKNVEKYKKLSYPTYRPILDNLQDSTYIGISAEERKEILGLILG